MCNQAGATRKCNLSSAANDSWRFSKGLSMKQISRRSFLNQTLAAAATVTIAGTKSTGRVLGANDVFRVGVAGIHGQGNAHIDQYLGLKGVQVTYLIDPDI